MLLRNPDKRVRVHVHGPDVAGVVRASDVEMYIEATGWTPFYVIGEGGWWAGWPPKLPTMYEHGKREEYGFSSPRDPRERLGRIINLIGRAERRVPATVLRDIEALGRGEKLPNLNVIRLDRKGR